MCKRTANREAWPAKYILFFFLVLATCFIPNTPLFTPIYLNIARAGSVIYILIQQVIFIDVAYNWNESWVHKADAAEAEDTGSGKKWLGAILVSCAILFLGTIVGIALLFVYFGGCSTNTAFVSVTLLLCILITAAQTTGEEGSLLASAVISAYATYLCYTAGTFMYEIFKMLLQLLTKVTWYSPLSFLPHDYQCPRIPTQHATRNSAKTTSLALCLVLASPPLV